MSYAPDYCTDDELKAYIRIPDADEVDDVQIAVAITAASRAIDDATRRQFGLTEVEARYYVPEWDAGSSRYIVRTDDFPGIDEDFVVAVDSASDETYATELVAVDYRATPLNSPANGRPFERLALKSSAAPPADTLVKVTAAWGWAEVPATIKQATLLQAHRFLKRREAWQGVSGSPEMGLGETRLLDKLDVDVALMVRAYRRQVWA